MEGYDVYRDIAERTEGSIYIGVVGPVRTGKSTFIKRFMDLLVIPNIDNEHKRERTRDELPQSANGKTIMTTEPKFVPNEAVELTLRDNAKFNVRLVDCVGYLVEGALGHLEENAPRMVNTPWFENQIPFEEAAEIGTRKVIADHSTIGLVVTTDGSITELPRRSYIEAEERVIKELKELDKPFIVVLNTAKPKAQETIELREALETKYGTPVVVVDCMRMEMEDLDAILEKVLFEFPVREVNFHLPRWTDSLDLEHWLKKGLVSLIKANISEVFKIRDVEGSVGRFAGAEHIQNVEIGDMRLGEGVINVNIDLGDALFYRILGEVSGYDVSGDYQLISLVKELAHSKREYDKVKEALNDVKEFGYGMVAPSVEEIRLEEPVIAKQGNKFGVKLRASAPSLHIIRADIETEIAPIMGTEKQSEEFIRYFMEEFENNPQKIWESNMFGKSLYDMVTEELQGKLYKMPDDIQGKLQLTLQRVVNNNKGGFICIII